MQWHQGFRDGVDRRAQRRYAPSFTTHNIIPAFAQSTEADSSGGGGGASPSLLSLCRAAVWRQGGHCGGAHVSAHPHGHGGARLLALPGAHGPRSAPHLLPHTSLTRAPPSFPILATGGGAELVGGGLQRPHAPLRLQHGRVHGGGQRGGESRPPHRPALPQRSAFRAAAFGTHGLTSPLHPCTPQPQSIRPVSHAPFPTALEVGP
jgi:hypothetical protein